MTGTKLPRAEARRLGAEAFERGDQRAPVLDAGYRRLYEGKSPTFRDISDLAAEWLRGWDVANLSTETR